MRRHRTIFFCVSILLEFTALHGPTFAQSPPAATSTPYKTPEALLGLIQARDNGVIDTNIFDAQLKQRGVGFDLDAKTILGLSKSGVTDAQILELDQACKQAQNGTSSTTTSNAPPASGASTTPGTATAPKTNAPSVTNTPPETAATPKTNTAVAAAATLGTTNKLSDLLNNQTLLASNITANGHSLEVVGGGLSTLSNGDVTTVQSNLVTYGGKLVGLGTNLVQTAPQLPYLVFLSSGATFQNPYRISVNNDRTAATLTNAGNSTVGFVEFTYINRYVLRPAPNDTTVWYFWKGYGLSNGLSRFPDIELHTGFTFAGSSSSGTTYSAASIAGGSDFYSEASLGLPLARFSQPTQRHQVSLEFSGGAATDKSFEAVHPQAFAGLGYQVSFKALGLQASTNACGFFSGRIGAGWVDSPRILPSSASNTVTSVAMSGGLPKFDFEAAPVASLGARLLYPLTESVYLTVNANVYMKDNPAPWNISVGASIPFASVAKVFGGFTSNQ